MSRRKAQPGTPAGMWILDQPGYSRARAARLAAELPTRVVQCPECEGDGYCGPGDRCGDCNGSGEVLRLVD